MFKKSKKVIRTVIQLGFLAPKLLGVSMFQKGQLGGGCKIINVREFLAEKLGVVVGKFENQNRTPD